MITRDDIDPRWAGSVSIQEYGGRPRIDGVQQIDLKRFVDDGGSFAEICRLADGKVLGVPGFELAQVNFSDIQPGAVKAWHLHLRQDDLWFVPPSSRLVAGLLDVRRDSKTVGVPMRLTLGDGRAQLLFIPRGVAHGVANLSQTSQILLYFVDSPFTPDDPDELRLDPNLLGSDFWKIEAA